MDYHDLDLETGSVTDRVDTLVKEVKSRLDKYPFINQKVRDNIKIIFDNLVKLEKFPIRLNEYKRSIYTYLNSVNYQLKRIVG